MSNMPWFRAYTEMVDDEKLRLLAFEDRWHFVALLCLKGQGVLESSDPLMMRKVAVKLGIDLRTLEEVARRLSEVGLIDRDSLQPLAWDNRQMKSDTSAERTRAYRERKKRHGDVTVTAQEEDTDKDKEEDKEKTKPRARAAAPAPDFSAWPAEPSEAVWADYVKHRKAKRAPLTQTVVNAMGREATKASTMGYSVDAFLTECMHRGWQGGKAEWLKNDASRPSVTTSISQQRADWTARLWEGQTAEKDMGVIDAACN